VEEEEEEEEEKKTNKKKTRSGLSIRYFRRSYIHPPKLAHSFLPCPRHPTSTLLLLSPPTKKNC